ncbi:hypothetical protein H4R34_003785 [Dimargaris verticillata]|uniref:Late endosomal/lysosomal adaptor and MAPK and MTOR activator 5 n=1 Tax=Dimargaris verticillata TaxID=2761393 RepID=A0A9W8B030_9FUNG|nr:hypothetical protein H4R34_003785 [Dimargaris verticillata]
MDSPLEKVVDELAANPAITGVLIVDDAGFCLAARGDLCSSGSSDADLTAGYVASLADKAYQLALVMRSSDSSALPNSATVSTGRKAVSTPSSTVPSPASNRSKSTSAMANSLAAASSLPILQVTTHSRLLLITRRGSYTVCVAKKRGVETPSIRASPSPRTS